MSDEYVPLGRRQNIMFAAMFAALAAVAAVCIAGMASEGQWPLPEADAHTTGLDLAAHNSHYRNGTLCVPVWLGHWDGENPYARYCIADMHTAWSQAHAQLQVMSLTFHTGRAVVAQELFYRAQDVRVDTAKITLVHAGDRDFHLDRPLFWPADNNNTVTSVEPRTAGMPKHALATADRVGFAAPSRGPSYNLTLAIPFNSSNPIFRLLPPHVDYLVNGTVGDYRLAQNCVLPHGTPEGWDAYVPECLRADVQIENGSARAVELYWRGVYSWTAVCEGCGPAATGTVSFYP